MIDIILSTEDATASFPGGLLLPVTTGVINPYFKAKFLASSFLCTAFPNKLNIASLSLKIFLISIDVPFSIFDGLEYTSLPYDILYSCEFSVLYFDLTVTSEIEAMLGNASPLNPRVLIKFKSSPAKHR